VDTLDLATYLPLLQSLPVVCVHHNVESALLRRRALAETLPWRRAYLSHQAALMEAEERRWCGRVALNVAVSDPDREHLRLQAPAGRYITVPNGVDTDKFRPAEGKDAGIVFVGGTTWFPNKDALAFFSEEILPLLNDSRTAAPICWVGRATEQEQQLFQERHGIRMTGYVDDIRPYVHDAACYVVPLRVGGGTRLKILDAWAMGKAVVSTSVGCEGLDAEHGRNILIADSPQAFAEAVRAVLQDADLRDRLGKAARATVESTYSWDIIRESMTEEYLSLVPAVAGSSFGSAGSRPTSVEYN
jgi:glycosyltransferase involved in cell wall biosynthesis